MSHAEVASARLIHSHAARGTTTTNGHGTTSNGESTRNLHAIAMTNLLQSVDCTNAEAVREHIKNRIPALAELVTEMDDATVLEFVAQFQRIVRGELPRRPRRRIEPKARAYPENEDEDEEKEDKLDIERVAFRLDGIEMYALVVSLTAGFGFSSLEMISDEEFEHLGWPFTWIFVVTAPLTVLCGLYATIVFALCSMYAKTALGSNKDKEMGVFMNSTGIYRLRAFNHFLVSIACFAIDVLIICLAKFRTRFGFLVCVFLAYLLYDGLRDTKAILAAAGPIFAPPPPPPPPSSPLAENSDADESSRVDPHRHKQQQKSPPVFTKRSSMRVSLSGGFFRR
ncbi:hypothetical protein CTAYLR_002012 [Chrysophaeum taylorii]|uniref:Transmembrane protein n=1 Tax=Chrysophaeum taylorii TaxID=2483200 RepID=A0AAD7XGA7_9STRA|nr:hypothetical protein CTAYLR_002012 [Chrysophaeum taylorii]